MRLKTLSGLQREKIEEEYNELMKLIEHLKAILASESLVYDMLLEFHILLIYITYLYY